MAKCKPIVKKEPELIPIDLEPIISKLREIGPDNLLIVAIKGNQYTDLSTIDDLREREKLFKQGATSSRLMRVFE